MKIYFANSAINSPVAQDIYEDFLHLYASSDHRHSLVENPEQADIILVSIDASSLNLFEMTKNNPLLQTHIDKCFTFYENDNPIVLLRGIYSDANRVSIFQKNRTRAGAYMFNRKIKNHAIIAFSNNSDNYIKEYLFSFIGRPSHKLRKELFKTKFERPDILVENSADFFDLWNPEKRSDDRSEYYASVLVKSKFALCPRGAATNSIRLFEAMQLGVAPVIISDEWKYPKGPDWKKFSITVKEKQLNELEHIVSSYESSYAEMGTLARKSYDEYFSEQSYFNYLIDCCLDIKQHQIIPESFYIKFLDKLYISYIKRRYPHSFGS